MTIRERGNVAGDVASCEGNAVDINDVQRSAILTKKEDRMDDYGRELAAGKAKVPLDGKTVAPKKGYLVTATDQGCFMDAEVLEGSFDLTPDDRSVLQYWKVQAPPEVQREMDALRCIFEGFVEGMERDCALSLLPHGDMYVFVVRMADTQHQTNEIPLAGSPGSCVLFIDPMAVPESRSPANWMRARIQEHLAVTPQTLVVLIPSALIEFLIANALSKRGKRKVRQQYWKSIKAKRKNMGKKLRRELQECMSGTEVAVEKVRDWKYKETYINGIQTIVVAVAHTGKSPLEICSLVRQGQRLLEAPPDHYPDSGASDGMHACRFAIEQCDMTLQEVFNQFPKTFTQIGWQRVAVPDED